MQWLNELTVHPYSQHVGENYKSKSYMYMDNFSNYRITF